MRHGRATALVGRIAVAEVAAVFDGDRDPRGPFDHVATDQTGVERGALGDDDDAADGAQNIVGDVEFIEVELRRYGFLTRQIGAGVGDERVREATE